MSRTNVIRLCSLAALALWLGIAASSVAWRFDHAPQLGHPLLGGYIYPPWKIATWWWAWGREPAYRSLFINAAMLPLLPLTVLLMGLVWLDRNSPLKAGQRDKNLGLGTAADLLATGHVSIRPGGVVLGREGNRILSDRGDGHCAVFGRAGSGKGVRQVVPTLLRHPGSMIILDPKRELAAITARWRSTLGPVHILDLTDPSLACFNPLLEIRGETLVEDCAMAAQMLAYQHGDASARNGENVWNEAMASLATALLVHVRRSSDPTLGHLAGLALDIKAGRLPKSADPFVAKALEAHAKLYPKVRDSVNFTLETGFAFIRNSERARKVTSKSTFQASDLVCGDKPATVYITVPPAYRKPLRPLLRLVLQMLVSPLLHDPHKAADGREKKHALFGLIDEFPQLGRLDVIEEGLPICRGYGLRFMLVCQDLEQIHAAYGQHQSIIGNCQTILAIPGFNDRTLNEIVKWGGDHWIKTGGRTRKMLHAQGIKGFFEGTKSESETRTNVLNPRDLLMRASKETLVFMQGVHPTWLEGIRYYDHPAFKGRFDAPTTKPTANQGELPPWLN